MTVSTRWYDDEEVVLVYDFSGRWTWDEVYAAHKYGEAMAKAKPHIIFVLGITSDDIAGKHIPRGAVSHLSNLSRLLTDNADLAVIVTLNNMWLSLDRAVSKISKVYANSIRFAKSEEEAFKLFEARKAQLLKESSKDT